MYYRIKWMSLTGLVSNGDWFELKYKKMLEENISIANKDHKNEIHHWLEHSTCNDQKLL